MSQEDLVNVTAINTAHLKYNQLLVASLSDPICDEFRKMRQVAITHTASNPRKMLTVLRSLLRETKSWNQDVIDNHCKSVKIYCQNRLRGRISLDKLIVTSLVSTAKIMGTPRIGKPKGQIELDIPEPGDFVKGAFVKCARELHRHDNIALCTNRGSRQEMARNEKNIRKLVRNCVEEFILTSIPLQEILDNVANESDLVSEAKQILEDTKDEVKLAESGQVGGEKKKEEEELPPKEKKEGEEEGINDGIAKDMPALTDIVPVEDELVETEEIKHVPVSSGGEEEELIQKRERSGFFREKDHGFFSDEDLDSEDDYPDIDDDVEVEAFEVDE
jgi:hypothetical protein